MALPDGLYDLLLTEGLARSLADLDQSRADVSALKGGAAEFLADVITRQLSTILDDVSGDAAEKARRQLELVNELLVMLRQRLAGSSADGASAAGEVVDLVAPPLRVLRAVQRDQQFPVSPEIGLGVPWLFTAGKGSPSLLQEIRRELASSDQVDILVSFITHSGVRKLLDIAMALTGHPKLLLLDEPTSGVSAEEKFPMMATIMDALGQEVNTTVLFVEHDMDIVERHASRVIAFYAGRVIADDTPAEPAPAPASCTPRTVRWKPPCSCPWGPSARSRR